MNLKTVIKSGISIKKAQPYGWADESLNKGTQKRPRVKDLSMGIAAPIPK
jgi:hypothetical protein